MSGSGDRWLLLHGTPLTPAVWDDVATWLTPSGTVWYAAITPARGPATLRALVAGLAAQTARPIGRLPVVGHCFGRQAGLGFALLVPQRVATLTLLCSRDTPFPGR